ncbi:MAG: hypothetical protein HY862_10505 [Chloroflexi bacterium]|nr:hypothetical protein [Chloroflexota bacterium]
MAQLRVKLLLVVLVIALLFPPMSSAQDSSSDLVNLDHLRFLTEPITVEGQDMALVHIYSEYPEYEWVDAGLEIGLEAGRGIGGNGFMDLSGRDPDVPANLLKLVLVAPGMDNSALQTASVALSIRLDDEERITLPETVSPDSDYFWLDLLNTTPVTLAEGEHTLRVEYAGDVSDNSGLSKLDAFYLQPVVASRIFQTPDGRTFTLTYNTLTGESTRSFNSHARANNSWNR